MGKAAGIGGQQLTGAEAGIDLDMQTAFLHQRIELGVVQKLGGGDLGTGIDLVPDFPLCSPKDTAQAARANK